MTRLVVEEVDGVFLSGLRPRPRRQRVSHLETQGEEGRKHVIVTTMNDIPGYTVDEVFGEVFGLTVRSRHVGSDIGASLKGLIGGEVKGYTKMLRLSREEAIQRLRDETVQAGGNAVIAMRFDCNELMSNMTEVAAYGTAVTVQPA